MTTKEELQAFFNRENEDRKLIEKYEENILFFNYLLGNGRREDIEFVTHIKLFKYVDPLLKKGYFTKALNVLDEIVNDLENIRGQSELYEMYSEQSTFYKGVSFGLLKKHRKSNQYFKQLVKKQPTNDNYIGWYKSNKKLHIDKILNRIGIVALCFVLICIVLDIVKIQDFKVPVVIEAIVWITLLSSILISFVWKKIIDKRKYNEML